VHEVQRLVCLVECVCGGVLIVDEAVGVHSFKWDEFPPGTAGTVRVQIHVHGGKFDHLVSLDFVVRGLHDLEGVVHNFLFEIGVYFLLGEFVLDVLVLLVHVLELLRVGEVLGVFVLLLGGGTLEHVGVLQLFGGGLE